MNRSSFWKGAFLFLTATGMSFAQQPLEDFECKHKFKKAKDYYLAYENPQENLKRDLEQSLKGCEDYSDKNKLFIEAYKAYLSNNEAERQQALSLAETAMDAGSVDAITLLGSLYQTGNLTKQDFDKAFELFSLAESKGDQLAKFKIGYFYAKGLGSVNQDFDKALRYFKDCTHSKAKLWLAIMYSEGWGVEEDLDKALGYLKFHNSKNAIILKDFIKGKKEGKQRFEAGDKADIKSTEKKVSEGTRETTFTITDLKGNYTGRYLEYDPSGNEVVKSLPVKASLNYDGYDDTLGYRMEIEQNILEGEAEREDNTALLEDESYKIKAIEYDTPVFAEIEYGVKSIDFIKVKKGMEDLIVATFDVYMPQYKEPSNKIEVVLKPEFLEEVLAAFANEKDEFLKTYPNPIKDELYLGYKLDHNANVAMKLVSLQNPNQVTDLIPSQSLLKGEQTHHFTGLNLQVGVYILNVAIEGKKYSKLIIKE